MDVYIQYPDHIVRVEDGAAIPIDDENSDYQAFLAWSAAGNAPSTPPPPTVDQVIAQFMPQLQQWMDGTAQQNGYDGVVSCVSYKDSGVAQWAADAAAMIAWRDAVWQWAYQQQPTLDAMTPEQVAALTPEYIISQAPKAADFDWVVHAPGAPAA